MATEAQVFRASWRLVFTECGKWVLILAALTLGIIDALRISSGATPLKSSAVVLSIVLGLAMEAAITALFAAYFVTEVTPDGICGFDVWGLSGFARWDDITTADTFRLAGLIYVRLHRVEGRPLYIPLFHSGELQFEEAVMAAATPASPAALFFAGDRA